MGDPVVLVHGLGSSSRYFDRLARLLARDKRVLAPDLPGWGTSERPPAPLDLAAAAGVLADVIVAEAIGAATLVGNSFGCQVAVELACRRPDLVSALVLISPTVDPLFRSWPRLAQALVGDAFREPAALWPIVARDYLRIGLRRFVATAAFALADRPEIKLPRVESPILVIRGERDAISSGGWARHCALIARDGRFEEVPEAAHAPHFSHPHAIAALVSTFVSELADRGDQLGGRLEHRHVARVLDHTESSGGHGLEP